MRLVKKKLLVGITKQRVRKLQGCEFNNLLYAYYT